MPTLYVSYFGAVDAQVAGDPISSTTITTSASSAATSLVVPDATKVVQVVGDASHYVAVGADTPTASAANGAVQFANNALWLRVEPKGASLRIAAVTV